MYAKVLGQDWAWRVGGMARRPAGLEQSKSLVPVGFARCPLGTESDLPEGKRQGLAPCLCPLQFRTINIWERIIFLCFFFFFFFSLYFLLLWVFVAMRGFSLVAAIRGCSLCCTGFPLRCLLSLQSTGSRCGGSVVAVHELSCSPWHMESSWTRDQTQVPCIGRRILIHCTTREAHG